VNTKATEVLYQTVGQLAELDMDTTLVDVCCGLGTIGLCLAKEVKQVSRLRYYRKLYLCFLKILLPLHQLFGICVK
jgi:hypothetical protein